MENENKTNETVEQRELAILADFVTRPKPMARYAEQFLIAADDFTIPAHRTAWDHLMNASHDDEVALLNIVRTDLGLKGGKKVDAFLDLQSVTDAHAKVRLYEFAMLVYSRKAQAVSNLTIANFSGKCDADFLQKALAEAVGAIPKPPSIGREDSEQLAAENVDEGFAEIPNDLLHVPGFVDSLISYSLKCAFNPNRVLAFAGAISALAHLAGRLFTDRRRTRTNLYVIAAGHSGIGKDNPRRVNREVMKSCLLSDTVKDQIASGESLEEMLYRKPCVLFQVDEIQMLLDKVRDKRNAISGGIVAFMNSLYSASGSEHSLRPKATTMATDGCGRVIFDPSLTVFGTGIAHGIYKALTPEVIETGFLGRCLIFDTEFEGESNKFEEENVELPRDVVNAAQELAARHHRIGGNRENKPTEVPYAEGVNDRINDIFELIKQRRISCKKDLDDIGMALWSRAPEKVSKLALVYAISENYANPVISRAAVEWAWELTELLVRRMLDRVSQWMTCGKVDENARRVLEFIRSRKDAVTRHVVSRKFRDMDSRMLDDVERLLEDRGEITIVQLNKQTRKYVRKNNK